MMILYLIEMVIALKLLSAICILIGVLGFFGIGLQDKKEKDFETFKSNVLFIIISIIVFIILPSKEQSFIVRDTIIERIEKDGYIVKESKK